MKENGRLRRVLDWGLVPCVALLALWASDFVVLCLEMLIHGRRAPWPPLLMSLCGGYAFVLAGAKVAPSERRMAALLLSCAYAAFTAAGAFYRIRGGEGPARSLSFLGLGVLGAGLAARRARGWEPGEGAEKA